MRTAAIAILLVGACEAPSGRAAGEVRLPPSDAVIETFEPGVAPDNLLPAIDQGLRTPGKGVDVTRFIVIRTGDRHGARFRHDLFHCVVGGGVAFPAGSLIVRKEWSPSGEVDGVNEQPQTWGLSVVVEPDTPRPYGEEVTTAVASFCAAVARRAPIHPDCVLAMGEIPGANPHEADLDERSLAEAARASVPVPPAPRKVVITTQGGPHEVRCEHRDTVAGIRVGLMFRWGFDGPDRGMLFEYQHPTYRWFWMKNCRIPIDLAYIRDGKIEQIYTMEAQFGAPHQDLRQYPSNAAIRFALEMPAGWFERYGVRVGDGVAIQ